MFKLQHNSALTSHVLIFSLDERNQITFIWQSCWKLSHVVVHRDSYYQYKRISRKYYLYNWNFYKDVFPPFIGSAHPKWNYQLEECSLQWRLNERDGVSNNHVSIVYSTVCSGADQRKTPKLRVTGLCAVNSPVTGEFPAQRSAVSRKMFPYDYVIMSKACSLRLMQFHFSPPGVLAMIAWLGLAATAMITTRHYRTIFNEILFGKAIWFQVNIIVCKHAKSVIKCLELTKCCPKTIHVHAFISSPGFRVWVSRSGKGINANRVV